MLKRLDDYIRLVTIRQEFKSSKFLDFLLLIGGKRLLKNNRKIFKERYGHFKNFKSILKKPISFKDYYK